MTRLLRSLWYVLQLRCDEAERLMHVRREPELSWSERSGLRVHRALCRSCRETQRRLRQLSELLKESELEDVPVEAHAPGTSGAERDSSPRFLLGAEARRRLSDRLRDAQRDC